MSEHHALHARPLFSPFALCFSIYIYIYIHDFAHLVSRRKGTPISLVWFANSWPPSQSAIVVSIVRAVYIEDLIRRDPDVFWSEGRVAIWSCVEVNLGIVCNCLVLLRPFVYRHIPWLVGQRSGPPRHRRWPRRTALASRSIGGHAFHPWHAGRHDDDDDEDKDDERTGGRCNVSCPNSGAGSPPKKCARGVLVESMVAVEYQEKEVRARSLEDEEEGVKAEQGAEEPRQRNAVSVIVVGGGDTAGPQSAPATTLEAVV